MLGTSLYDTAAFQRRLWTPAVLRGQNRLSAWWDCAELGTIGSTAGEVDGWADKSGNGRAATSSAKPNWDLNGWTPGTKHAPCIAFVNDEMNYTGAFISSFQVAARNSGAATARTLLSGANSSVEYYISSAQVIQVNRLNQAAILTGTTTIPTGYVLLGLDQAASRTDIWVNGSVQTSAVNGGYTQPNSAIGRRSTTDTNPFDSAIAEIVMMSTAGVWTATEQAQVQGYLAWKWGIVDRLPVTHLYKKHPPMIGG